MKLALQVRSKERKHPMDRRRIVGLANELAGSYKVYWYSNIKTLKLDQYDCIIVHVGSDLRYLYKEVLGKSLDKRPVIIFDYCDLIHLNNRIKFVLKTTASWYRKEYSFPLLRSEFEKLIELVDAVVVGSEAQKEEVKRFNSNIHVISDVMDEVPKLEWSVSNGGLFWEGFSNGNAPIFQLLLKTISQLGIKDRLFVVTDEDYYLFAGRFFRRKTKNVVENLLKKYPISGFELKDWQLENLLAFSKKAKIAILPIPEDRMASMKPENKLILMIRLGLYPIASRIPSYLEFSEKYGLNICFQNLQDVKNILDNFENEEAKLLKVRDLILDEYSKEQLVHRWDTMLQSTIKAS